MSVAQSVEAQEGLGDAGNDVVVDELLLAAGSVPQCGGSDPVDFAKRALRELVQGREREGSASSSTKNGPRSRRPTLPTGGRWTHRADSAARYSRMAWLALGRSR
jgi:hypothetical protein